LSSQTLGTSVSTSDGNKTARSVTRVGVHITGVYSNGCMGVLKARARSSGMTDSGPGGAIYQASHTKTLDSADGGPDGRADLSWFRL